MTKTRRKITIDEKIQKQEEVVEKIKEKLQIEEEKLKDFKAKKENVMKQKLLEFVTKA